MKDKLQRLKLATSNEQSTIQETYRPMIQPLENLISTIGKTEPTYLKYEPIDIKEEYHTATQTKQKLKQKQESSVLPHEPPSFFDTCLAI